MSIAVTDVWGDFGYLSNTYPSPFNARGRRWRTVNDFVNSEGGERSVLLEGVTEKFKQNQHLMVELEGTDQAVIVGDGDLPSVLMEVRSSLSDMSRRGTSSFKRMMVSLLEIVKKMHYDTFYIGGSEINLVDVEEGDRRVEMEGKDSKGVVDIVLSKPITDKYIQGIINPHRTKGMDTTYVLIGNLSRTTITKSLAAMSGFHNLKYFSPSELLVEYSNHILTPRVEIIPSTDPIYSLPVRSLPEISADDPYMRQLGIRAGRGKNRVILGVHDHSPHYREVV